RAALVRLIRAVTKRAAVAPNIFSSNPVIEACLRANEQDAYVLVINHEAEQPRTSVRIENPKFGVKEIFNLTENRKQDFQKTGEAIAFDIEAPRERPQLLHLLRNS
ncbi:MAG TPA: hypothetical protein VFL96_13675, partial [Acidobacteriaceae bacterium]|nr:hypothetical protein [Acidobacteriaceae bacterium]